MRKLSLLSVLGFVLIIASCNSGANKNDGPKSAADSASKADSGKHDKLVRALVTDTNQNNFTDAQGKKQGHWVITNQDRHLSDYSEKAKIEEGSYRDNMKEGEWLEYNADGSVKSRSIYKDDKQVQ